MTGRLISASVKALNRAPVSKKEREILKRLFRRSMAIGLVVVAVAGLAVFLVAAAIWASLPETLPKRTKGEAA